MVLRCDSNIRLYPTRDHLLNRIRTEGPGIVGLAVMGCPPSAHAETADRPPREPPASEPRPTEEDRRHSEPSVNSRQYTRVKSERVDQKVEEVTALGKNKLDVLQ